MPDGGDRDIEIRFGASIEDLVAGCEQVNAAIEGSEPGAARVR
jgi:hypothetical protein